VTEPVPTPLAVYERQRADLRAATTEAEALAAADPVLKSAVVYGDADPRSDVARPIVHLVAMDTGLPEEAVAARFETLVWEFVDIVARYGDDGAGDRDEDGRVTR
jgi:hypothetical protein